MKYIKLFESVGDMYKEISVEEHLIVEYDNQYVACDFTNNEISVLLKLGFNLISKSIMESGRTEILKIEDDWFYVTHSRMIKSKRNLSPWYINKYYKCDQFDGLLMCLEKECVIE